MSRYSQEEKDSLINEVQTLMQEEGLSENKATRAAGISPHTYRAWTKGALWPGQKKRRAKKKKRDARVVFHEASGPKQKRKYNKRKKTTTETSENPAPSGKVMAVYGSPSDVSKILGGIVWQERN